MNLQAVDGGPRHARKLQDLTRFCAAIGQCHQMEDLWNFAVRVVPRLIDAQGAGLLLLDPAKVKFDVAAVCFDDPENGRLFKTIRFPADADMAGIVCTTGQARIVQDYVLHQQAGEQTDPTLRQLIQARADVPLTVHNRPIGVLTACNTKREIFTEEDIQWMHLVAGLTALAVEKITLQNTLIVSCQGMRDFNSAKSRVIDHISHALKTPIAVLIASMKILEKHLRLLPDHIWRKVYHRIQRNLERLLRIEYEVEDILRNRGDAKPDPPFSAATSRGPSNPRMAATGLNTDSDNADSTIHSGLASAALNNEHGEPT